MKKNIVTLTETDLVKLIKKMINEQEQGSELFEDYMDEIQEIFREFVFGPYEEVTEEDLDNAHDNIAQVLNDAENDKNISDDEFEELYQIADEMHRELDLKFETMNGLNERVEDDVEDEDEDEEEMIHHSREKQHRHSDPDEFTLIGKVQRKFERNGNIETKYPLFILRNRNKTEDGTQIIGFDMGLETENKVFKLTGVTKNGKPPSFQNPMKLTKRPQRLSR
jgi:hypothetical protein